MPLFSETHHRDHRDIPTTHTPEPATLGFTALVFLAFAAAIYFRKERKPQ